MLLDIEKLLRDFHISYADGSVTRRFDWIHVHCPFCPGVPDFHLGYNIKDGRWNCWRCGGKRTEQVLQALVGLDLPRALALYAGRGRSPNYRAARPLRIESRKIALPPVGCGPMGKHHFDYLKGRNFDPEQLEEEWELLGTGVVGPDKLRIVAPILHDGRMVSWQGRDITGRARAKYRACPPEMEARPIKSCLYGLERTNPEKGCVVVEGITDVWRLGPGAVATFGTEWKLEQALLLLPIRKVFVLFDSGEEAARMFSDRLCSTLKEAGANVEQLDIGEGDPGGLDQEEADHIMKELKLL